MTTPPSIVQLVGLDDFVTFSHEAMATQLVLHLPAEKNADSRAVAEEAFRLIDTLEDRLSFYREGSDVTRINRASSGDTIRLHETTITCLLTALEVAQASDGRFDPFTGHAALTAKQQTIPAHLIGFDVDDHDDRPVIALDPTSALVTKIDGTRWLDLGAVGKGAALDAVAELLTEWDITTAALVAGGSSVLVLGNHPARADGRWTLRVPAMPGRPTIHLSAPFALGASGDGFQPGHIITGGDRPARPQALVIAPTAAWADALSTAALLQTDDELKDAWGELTECSIFAAAEKDDPYCSGPLRELAPAAPQASLVIPCWNESERLPPFLRELCTAVRAAALAVEIMVVDDKSPAPEPEKTAAAVEKIRREFAFLRPMHQVDHHRGKGGAVYHGWRHANTASHWLAFVDADGAVPAQEVVRGLQTAMAETADPQPIIAANRYHHETSRPVQRGPIRQRSGHWFARYAKRKLGLQAEDCQCGFKVVPATWWRARQGWQEEGYAFDLELMQRAQQSKIPVTNLAIAWKEIGGSSVTWRDGLKLVQAVQRLKKSG